MSDAPAAAPSRAGAAASWRIGVDLGGTKIEAVALDGAGRERARRRIATPAGDYERTVDAVAGLVRAVEGELGIDGARTGIGIPGSLSPATGLVRNANSLALNGRPLAADLGRALDRPVRVENDANCFALSEAVDGAGSGGRVVFGVILGTGVGGGLVVDGRIRHGANGIAGEWGHLELPARAGARSASRSCWCGRIDCIETWLSGPALARDHAGTGDPLSEPATAAEVAAAAARGDAAAAATVDRYVERLAAALALVVHVVDPDRIVLGGGVSNVERLAERVEAALLPHLFADRAHAAVRRAWHGDASGVRGAAWLWPVERDT